MDKRRYREIAKGEINGKKSNLWLQSLYKLQNASTKKEKICPNCKGKDFSDEWSGIFILFKPEESEIAKLIGIKTPGMYAIKVR
jgi:DNA-directed RNA polymerase, subunit E''''